MLGKRSFRSLLSGKKRITIALGLGLLIMVALATVRFNIRGHYEGLFLLKGESGALLELKDDLYLGDGHRLIFGIDFDNPAFHIAHLFKRNQHEAPYLSYEWVAKDGEGYVRNYLPGGQQLLTNFSRFIDDDGKQTAGLIVGGGLPSNVREDDKTKMNETGMAYFNGTRWFHIWCNVNESFTSVTSGTNIYPSQWQYLGSMILNASDKKLTISSSHVVTIDNIPLRMDRIVYFTAGEPYFILSIRVNNAGKAPVKYYYSYADEPWLGNYGSSAGNVGWVKDRLIQHVEQIDTKKYNYVGMFDYGNDAIGEGHDFTMMANFLEWQTDIAPSVYFSNSPYQVANEKNRDKPLSSNERFMGAYWGPLILEPGESNYFHLAIGMAGRDQQTGFPVKPDTPLNH